MLEMLEEQIKKNKTGGAPVKLKKEQKKDGENEIQSSVECEEETDTKHRSQ